MKTRYVEMYSLVEWPKELRTNFCLGYDPYHHAEGTVEGIAASKARELLQGLGVFFYRDIENGYGLRVSPIQGQRSELFQNQPERMLFDPILSCYFFNVNVAYPSIRPLEYVPPKRRMPGDKLEIFRQKHGDIRQWLAWNKPVKLVYLDNRSVKHETGM